LTDSSGAVIATSTYDPYGKSAGSTGMAANPFGYAGSFTDSESGLVYLQHRYYDPATAQFTSVDPLADLTAQPYGYVGGDPLDQTDPAGLCHFYDLGCQVVKHAHLISTVTGVAAVLTAEVPPVSAVLGGISLTTGGIQTVKDIANGNYKALVFDAATLIPGAGAEIESVRLIGLQAKMSEVRGLIDLAVKSGDLEALRALQAELGALNNERRVLDAWAGLQGKGSVFADMAGWVLVC
jgi:RHS repeat-associated protein